MKKIIAMLLAIVMTFAICGTAMASSGQLVGTDILANAQATALDIAEEGDVLIKNINNSLPLKAPEEGKIKVNVFGTSSLDAFYGGGGSGAVSVSGDADFYSALTKAGIEYNTQLHDTYAEWYAQYQEDTSYAGTGGATGMTLSSAMNAEWDIMNDQYDEEGALRRAKMNPEILAGAKAYSDTAIVFIARSGSEGADLSQSDLELRESEVAMLAYVTANFENVIVIFNICNVMEMGWLNGNAHFTFDDYSYGVVTGGGGWGGCGGPSATQHVVKYDVPHEYTIGECDSALIIWAPGEAGMAAVGEILVGAVNPSGKLADTIAYDIDSNPTTCNFGSTTFADSTSPFNVYEENIYVGYLYYETFAANEVQYPFGFGLSYTTFAWSGAQATVAKNEFNEDAINIEVAVKNTGAVSGKDVVEAYYSQPYYNDSQYKVEKAIVNLGAFEKTSELAPNAEEKVKLSVNVRDMASWSSVAGAYVLEAGNYKITLATDANKAHTAPAFEYIYNVPETVIFGADEVTGTKYSVLFEDSEGYGEVTENYMHRVDVDGVPTVADGTFPVAPDGTEHVNFAERAEKYGSYYFKNYSTLATPDFSDAPKTKLEDAEQQGVVYYDKNLDADPYTLQEVYADLKAEGAKEDEIWDKFLDQLTIYDMIYLTGRCGYMTAGLEQYGIPEIADQDGPAAIKYSTNVSSHPEGTLNGEGCAYPVATCMACTWNKELARIYGESVGTEGVAIDTYGWYAPAIDNHRSPMAGRNFEYFSEDSYLGGKICGQVIAGCQSKGVVCYIKHFALNDQETERMGICTFAKEQAIREVYLEAFEIAIKESNCHAVMSGFNRIGIDWCGGKDALLISVLRDEWGFVGSVLTDYYLGGYQNAVLAALNGNDTLLSPGYTCYSNPNANLNNNAKAVIDYYKIDPVGIINGLRYSVKNLCEKAFYTGKFAQTLDPEYKFGVTNNTWYSTVTIGSVKAGISPDNRSTTIEIPVTIENNEGLSAIRFKFKGLDFTGARVLPNFGSAQFNNKNPELDVVWWNEEAGLTDDIMFTISLPYSTDNLNEDKGPLLKDGEYTITADKSEIIDRLTNDTDIKLVNGKVTIENNYLPGDVTKDFVRSNADLVIMSRYVVGLLEPGSQEELDVKTWGDVNGDGRVSNEDLVLLSRIVVGLA